MQKNISIRRSAQKLAKAGQLNKAISAYEPLLASGSADPYDHLYVGDLYIKLQQKSEAIKQYEAAIDEYYKLGFHRNGVALCRKILRLDNSRIAVIKRLGDLYAEEELLGDALESYATFLERASENERSEAPFREVVEAIHKLGPQRADKVIELSVVLKRVDRPQDALELLLQAYETVLQSNDEALADTLKQSIIEINPDYAEQLTSALDVVEQSPNQALDEIDIQTSEHSIESSERFGDIELADPTGEETANFDPVELVAEASGDDLKVSNHTIEIDLDEGSNQEDILQSPSDDLTADELRIDSLEAEKLLDSIRRGELPVDDGESPVKAQPTHDETDLSEDTESVDLTDVRRDFSSPETSDEQEIDLWQPQIGPAGSLANPRQATLEAIEAEQWTSAYKRAQEWIVQDGESEESIDCLILASRALDDVSGLVDGLLRKGDLLVNKEEFEKAVPLFQEVLELEPENQTACRRIGRFREMGLIDGDRPGDELANTDSSDDLYEIPEQSESEKCSVSQVLAGNEAFVDIKQTEPAPGDDQDQQEWMEIGALLEEFKDRLKDQVEDNDFQGHYDMAVSHMEMELYDEALEEFDSAISCTDYPKHMIIKIKEMRGICFSSLERHREAIHEFRDALDSSDVKTEERSGFKFLLAKELEVVGELDEAKRYLRELLQECPDFEEAQCALSALEEGVA